MKIKGKNIDFISFSDGVCSIYFDDDGEKEYKYESLGFSDKVLGLNRYYSARANKVQVNRVITIPRINNIDTHDLVEIQGVGIYEIEIIQGKFDTNPESIDLTLRLIKKLGD